MLGMLGGAGISLNPGGQATLERVLLEYNHSFGLTGSGAETSVAARDVTIRGTLLNGFGHDGFGISLSDGASMDLERGWIGGSKTAGVLANYGSSFSARDLTIQNSWPNFGHSSVQV